MGRSRSPARKCEWISRAVTTFGRYPQKRPTGLIVESDGSLRLSSIVEVWGKQQNLGGQDILDAVRKHTFKGRGTGDDALRFTIKAIDDDEDDYSIKVHQKRAWGEKSNAAWAPRVEVKPLPTPVRGSVCLAPNWPQSSDNDVCSTSSAWKLLEKQVPAVKEEMRANDEDDDCVADSSWRRDDAWQKSDTTPSWKVAAVAGGDSWKEANRTSTAWKDDAASSWGASRQPRANGGNGQWGRQNNMSNGEKVQRWLSFVLKSGQSTLNVKDGWAKMDDVVDAISRDRADLGVSDEAALLDILHECDTVGRFEIRDGWLHKLPREQRQTPSARDQWQAQAPRVDQPETKWDQQRQARATTPPRKDRAPSEPKMDTTNQAPSAPPGPDWKQFHDDGTIWWYYEGPKGKWWCEDKSKDIQLWTDD